MRILIDSADIQAVEQALKTGYVYGVTTNPTLLQRARVRIGDVPALARAVLELGAHELHLQVYSPETAEMLEQARQLFDIDPRRVVVKIPVTAAGYAAAARLVIEGVRVTLTAVYTVAQVVLAQSINAHYVAVYVGRMRDDGLDALGLVRQMQGVLNVQHAGVEILAASIRAPVEVEQLAEIGVPAVTLPLEVLRQLPESPQTAAAAAAFVEAAESLR